MGEFNPFDPELTNKTTAKSVETPEISNEDRVKIKQEEAIATLMSLADSGRLFAFLEISSENNPGMSGQEAFEAEKTHIKSLDTAEAIESYLNRINEFEKNDQNFEE